MCYQLWLRFRYCPHVHVRQRTCHEDPELNVIPLFCRDYKHESKTIVDACPRVQCQQGKYGQIRIEMESCHAAILASAAQKTGMRTMFGLPDLIQMSVAEIDVAQQASIARMNTEEAVLRRQHQMFLHGMAQRQGATLAQTYSHHTAPIPASLICRPKTPSNYYGSESGEVHISRHTGRAEHRGYLGLSSQLQEQRSDSVLSSALAPVSNYQMDESPGYRPQRPVIRFGVHGGLVNTASSQLGRRVPTAPTTLTQTQLDPAEVSLQEADLNGAVPDYGYETLE